jgi:hypothetical protein
MKTIENSELTNTENIKPELDSNVADILNLDQALFDEYLIRNIKTRQSTSYYVIFDTETGRPEPYETVVKELKPGVTETQYTEFYDNVITNDQCVIEYDFPLVSVKRILHVKQGGFSIRELCGLISRDFADIYREQLWVPGVSLFPKDLSVNAFYVFHEPITVPADPNLCVTRIAIGVEPKVLTKLKEMTEQSKSKGTIKQMMKKITEIAQENAMNAVQAPIIEVEPIMNPPQSLATLAESLPDENEEEDELMNKIVNEILPAVANAKPKKTNQNSVANNRERTTVKTGRDVSGLKQQSFEEFERSLMLNRNSDDDSSSIDSDNNELTSSNTEKTPTPEKAPAKKRGRTKAAAPTTTKAKAPPKTSKNSKVTDESAIMDDVKKPIKKAAPAKRAPKKQKQLSEGEFGAISDTAHPPKGGIEDMFSKFQ